MRFIELIIPSKSEISREVEQQIVQFNLSFSSEDFTDLVRKHLVYFENKPLSFLPFQVHRKGKLQIYIPDEKSWKITPSDVLYEDKWIIAINKPCKIPSQASLNLNLQHAYGAVKSYLRNKKTQTSPVVTLFHRLDMDTSGVLIMGKKASINKPMADLFASRKIKKTYLALSQSKTIFEGLKKFKIESYLKRAPSKKHKFRFSSGSKEDGKYALTHVELTKQKNDVYLFEVHPQTGRSHQIRVHLSEEGFSILGDLFYEGQKASHLFLHAHKLEFPHPINKDEILSLKAPLPKHWNEHLKNLEVKNLSD